MSLRGDEAGPYHFTINRKQVRYLVKDRHKLADTLVCSPVSAGLLNYPKTLPDSKFLVRPQLSGICTSNTATRKLCADIRLVAKPRKPGLYCRI